MNSFSPDEVRSQAKPGLFDEPIGGMWLALDEAYPKGTEVLVTAELDEKNTALQITAALKNDPSIKSKLFFLTG